MQKILIVLSALIGANSMAQTFPPGFQWCVATAGHQVEGDNVHSDWWQFEQRPGAIKNGERSGKASFHMDRLEEDVKIMKDLGVKTYRFSIEWSRIEPDQGKWDQKAIDHYRRELKLLKAAGIEPMVTIHHFVSPQWFAAGGGWKRADAPELFLKYAMKLYEEFGKDVVYWITINEPTVLLIGGYGEGFFAPGEKSWDLWTPGIQMLRAHGAAYKTLHEMAKLDGRPIKIGVAHHLRPVSTPTWWLRKPIEYANRLLNWNFLEAMKTGEVRGFRIVGWGPIKIPIFAKAKIDDLVNSQDFVGVNYYTRESIYLSFTRPFLRRDPYPGLGASELNWGLDPEGFYEVLKDVHRIFPNLPAYITENGLADAKDQWRGDYIKTHLAQMHKAMTEIPMKIEGYCHWSLMDNFEWHEGFGPRFGLIEVDYANGGTRKLRPSAEVARKIFKSNSLD